MSRTLKFIWLSLAFSIPVYADIPSVQEIVGNVVQNNSDTAALDSYQEFLIGNENTPNPLKVQEGDDRRLNQSDHTAAQAFVSGQMNSCLGSGNVYSQSFSDGINYIGDLVGTVPSSGVILIGAHIDSTQSRSGGSSAPGGDDNGTGVAGMLEALRVLSQYTFEKTIRFALFDHEESGWDTGTGSWQYVQSLSTEEQASILSMTSFDMVGYNHNGNDIATLCIKDTDSGREWQSQFETAIEQYTSLEADLTKESKWSDHHAFDTAGIAAGLLVEELNDSNWPENPYYHTTDDYVIDLDGNWQTLSDGTTPYVDVHHATEMTKATVGWAATLATPLPEPSTMVMISVFSFSVYIVRRFSLSKN